MRRPTTFLMALFGLAILAPAGAAAHQHHLTTYRAEKHVDLASTVNSNGSYIGRQSVSTTVACNHGDDALDGMWRVDHVDQANAQTGTEGDVRDVRVLEAYPTGRTTYQFKFSTGPKHLGRSQLKIWVTCIGKTTGVDGHDHAVRVSEPHTDSGTGFEGGTPMIKDRFPTACSADQLAVAPGFRFTPGSSSPGSGKLYRSHPATHFRDWQWNFLIDSGSFGSIHTYLKCMDKRTVTASGHTHPIENRWVGGTGGEARHLSHGNQEQQQHCGDLEKGLVGAFSITDPHHVTYLGMDPREKTRAYRFFYDGSGSNMAHLNLLCLGDRTGH